MNKYPDLFKIEKSVTKRFSILLNPDHHNSSLSQLKEEALEILNLPDTIVSKEKKMEYEKNILRMKSLVQFQFYLSNIILKGSNLSLNNS